MARISCVPYYTYPPVYHRAPLRESTNVLPAYGGGNIKWKERTTTLRGPASCVGGWWVVGPSEH